MAPFVKVGGLGDVMGSLPKALEKLGIEVTAILPRYESIKILEGQSVKKKIRINFDGKECEVRVWEAKLPDSKVRIFLLENKRYLSTGEIYPQDKQLKIDRFLFFSKAVETWLYGDMAIWLNKGNCVVHLHDWHTGALALLLKKSRAKAKIVFTIHNLGADGKITWRELGQKLGIKERKEKEKIRLLELGIKYADRVTTVSSQYAKEILAPEFGGRLSELLKSRGVMGVLNGIDTEYWNAETDRYLAVNYYSNRDRILKGRNSLAQGKFAQKVFDLRAGRSEFSMHFERDIACLKDDVPKDVFSKLLGWQEGKRENKLAAQKKLGLRADSEIPLIVMVARLDRQKGFDLLTGSKGCLEKILETGAELVILGTGTGRINKELLAMAKRWRKKGRFSFVNKFNEPLSHLLYGAGDLFLMPSRFEPCGLTQMIAQRYGSLPIVRKVGGLKDTVEEGVNGWVFEKYSSEDLLACVMRATGVYKMEKRKWKKMVETAMNRDFSWRKSAEKYVKIYI